MKSIPGGAVLACFCALAVSGCASFWPQTAQLAEGLPQGLPERVELTSVPFFPQVEYQCGPAALATTLAATGIKVTPDGLVSQAYIPERKGSLQIEMLAAARRRGLVSYELAPRFEDLLREIAAGNPVIVLQNVGFIDGWHYAVAIGYDYDRGELILRSGETGRKVLPFPVHEMVWKRSGYWAMLAVPRDAARRAPDSVVVLNNLAQTLSDQGRHEEALPFIERAAAHAGPFAQAVQQTRQLVLDRIAAEKKGKRE